MDMNAAYETPRYVDNVINVWGSVNDSSPVHQFTSSTKRTEFQRIPVHKHHKL